MITLRKKSLEDVVGFTHKVVSENYGANLEKRDICKYAQLFNKYFHELYIKNPSKLESRKNVYQLRWE